MLRRTWLLALCVDVRYHVEAHRLVRNCHRNNMNQDRKQSKLGNQIAIRKIFLKKSGKSEELKIPPAMYAPVPRCNTERLAVNGRLERYRN